jgi:hypothetical protein
VSEVDRFPALGLILRLGHAGAGAGSPQNLSAAGGDWCGDHRSLRLCYLLAAIFASKAPAFG